MKTSEEGIRLKGPGENTARTSYSVRLNDNKEGGSGDYARPTYVSK